MARRDIRLWLPGLALLSLALLPRLYRLDGQSLWLDEGSSWAFAQLGWGPLLADLLSPTAAYPLYHLLLKLWIGLFGDSEAALRLPSALAGAAAVAAVYGAGLAWGRARAGLGAALIVMLSPFAIWYSQEAKAYSLLLLAAALFSWLLLRALRLNTRAAWLALAATGLAGLFVHRLMALLLVAGGLAWLLAGEGSPRRRALAGAGLAAATGLLLAAMLRGLGADAALGGGAIPADPLTALGLTFSRFSVDRWPGDGPWWWLLPWALLLGRAGWLLAGDLRSGGERRRMATALLCLLLAPLAIFLAALAFTRLYEPRYLTVIFPAWALVLGRAVGNGRPAGPPGGWRSTLRPGGWGLLAAALLSGGLALFQPTFGLFSGDPVKEQYREAIAELAARVHPDDAVVVHPGYIAPLYRYYMRRLSADPAPQPITFADFWRGETSYGQREWDIERRARLAGYTRSFLLIAPAHARSVDRPNAAAGDEYGLVGLFWAYSAEQRAWPCGIWRYNGAHLLCQEAPEPYYTGQPAPAPATPGDATFGAGLRLLGFSLKPTTPAGPGVYRAGGNLPISLFWEVAEQPAESYSFFLHLCQDCESPPVAGDDGPPLEGYLPTSVWLPGNPARDDRAVPLPADMPPGEYTLLLGVYDPTVPTLAGRLAVSGGERLGTDRLVLGRVRIVAADE